MNHFPAELIDRISSHLSHDDLKRTLLLSKSFRYPAEKYSSAFYVFKLHKGNAEKFVRIFSGHRLLFLRKLVFWIRLPRVEHSHRALRDNADQLRENDESFTRQLRFLFSILKTVEDRAGRHNIRGKIQLWLYTPGRVVSDESGRPTYSQHSSWRVHLLEPEALPTLESIRSLEIHEGGGSGMFEPFGAHYSLASVKLDYRVMLDLVAKLPNLEYWGCRIGGDEWTPKYDFECEAATYIIQDWAGPRMDARRDFARALESVKLPSTLRRVRLDFLHDLSDAMRIDHLTAQPNLVYPTPYDSLSTSLHHLSQNLRRIHLRVVADESLFWPKDGGVTSWPNLESLVVMFHMVSPSGSWYFEGPKGEGRDTAAFEVTNASYPPLEITDYDDEMVMEIDDRGHRDENDCNDQMRIVPNDITLRPFLAAFAQATANMARLREAALWCPLRWQPHDYDDSPYDSSDDDDDDHAEAEWLPKTTLNHRHLAWGIYYLAASERDWTHPSGPSSIAAQLWWRVAKWRPDPELHQLFQQIGCRRRGDTLLEYWWDDVHGEGLVGRDYFESFIQEEVEDPGRIPALN